MNFCSQLCILFVMVWSQLVSHTEGTSWPIMVTSYNFAFNVFTRIVYMSDKTFHSWVTIAPLLTCCCLRSGEFFWLYCWNYCRFSDNFCLKMCTKRNSDYCLSWFAFGHKTHTHIRSRAQSGEDNGLHLTWQLVMQRLLVVLKMKVKREFRINGWDFISFYYLMLCKTCNICLCVRVRACACVQTGQQ